MQSKPDPDRLSATFAALADPTRRAILRRLSRGEASVNELAEPFEMSLPGISKHLKVLERAGLITRGKRAQWRPCSLKPEPLRDAADWIEQYRKFWDASFDRLDDYLRELQAQEKQGATPKGKTQPHKPEGKKAEGAKPKGKTAEGNRNGRKK